MVMTALGYISLIFLTVLVSYLIVPEILLHHLGVGSWKRQYSPGVCITFDDGPDPLYTPKLLEILRKEKIPACFFLVGEQVEKYPELAKMIAEEGHIIGSHGYYHQHAWLMSPQKTWVLWDKSIDIIEKTIGKEPDYIRPPYGSVNLSLVLWSISRNKRIIGWNAVGKDWRNTQSSTAIINRILKHIKEGSIILLHDSGGDPGAPHITLSCVQELCAKIKYTCKLPIVPLHFPGWSLSRRISFRLWEKWEHLYMKINHIQRIDDENLFRLSRTCYRGPDLYSEDGKLLASKGDIIGEIHLDNIRFQTTGTRMQGVGIRALKQVRQSLPTLANYISHHPDYKDVQVYMGVTLLNRGVKGLGFNVQEYPSHKANLIGFLQRIVMFVYHPSGGQRDTIRLGHKPKIVWISKKKLLEKYKEFKKVIS